MKTIKLTQGKVALVSDYRFDELNRYKWHAMFNGFKWYARRLAGKFPCKKTVYMHRQIMNITDPKIKVDHCDNDGLNCQDENMRVCTNNENGYNRGKQSNNKSGFKGVFWSSRYGKYQVKIHANGKQISLGLFFTAEEGARAYDVAAKLYHGEFAKTNF